MNKLILSIAVASALALTGCDGDDGKDGVNGTNGVDGAPGQDGTPGSDGLDSLINSIELAAGHEVCLGGGVQFDTGLDDNANGTLEAAEIDDTSYACLPYDPVSEAVVTVETLNNPWFQQGQQYIEQALATPYDAAPTATPRAASTAYVAPTTSRKAKNVILFVGDGMGISTVTAARILEGQMNGGLGEENVLSFGSMPFAGLAKTYNVDAQTPDSAGTMTAMMSGVKTDVGVIGVDEDIVRGDCSTVAGNELVTALELAEIAGKSTGVISTARITHATPAATYAKSADRNWEDVSDMPAEAVAAGCEDIASQLVNFEANLEARFAGLDVDGIEVVMGGGRRHFLPKDASYNSPDAVSSTEGDRTDGRDLTAEWQASYPQGTYVYDKMGFDAINTATTSKLFGLFNESHMQYEADRKNDVAGEPSLRDMTTKAIEVLDNNEEGFFLMVESGRIDHGHHAGNAYTALTDTIEFAEAVKAAMAMTNDEETLIIVTADHSHVFTIAGYPKRGNPILGKVVGVGSDTPAEAADGMPYTTLGYTNGRGFMNLGDETNADAGYGVDINAGRMDLSDVDTTTPGYHQEALVPMSSETHAGEDVGIYASGPGASLVTGTNEQSIIFHIMDYAAELTTMADQVVD
ncbi:alkaline phosphatase [Neiella sp. HB171785]|uniref:Alkaline phosphatase n=1 Tax=Neiella litorisoli TaxID=2771431 RepID=A0A8J6QUP8_9GAMM|nr:alkaline phosphatase [Neiella litorisoli]MBD1389323.1 alkaline phosphatase [Neiella litorisoli]